MLIPALTTLVIAQSQAVTLDTTKVGSVGLRRITIDLKHPKVRIGVIPASGFPSGDESFKAMINRAKPLAAINGAYFDKNTKRPIGDILQDGELLHSGRMGTVLTHHPEKGWSMQRVVRHRTYLWEGYSFVLGCGPALVLEGKVDVDHVAEGFRDPSVTRSTYRTFVGLTGNNKMIWVQTSKALTFEEEAELALKLGCTYAMNLDAGASMAMMFKGKTLVNPSRKLTQLLGVWISP